MAVLMVIAAISGGGGPIVDTIHQPIARRTCTADCRHRRIIRRWRRTVRPHHGYLLLDRRLRVGPALAHRHRQRLLRRPAVHAEQLARGRRVRLPAPRHPARAEIPGGPAVAPAGLGRLAELLMSTMTGRRRGIDRERMVRDRPRERGLVDVPRRRQSLGDADLVALRAGTAPRLIEVKSTAAHLGRVRPQTPRRPEVSGRG